jgi:lysophospholipase L1-like esterase
MKTITLKGFYWLILLILTALLFEIGARWMYFHKNYTRKTALEQLVKEFKHYRALAKLPPPEEFNVIVTSEQEIRDLHPVFLRDRIGFGNTPFSELRNHDTESIFVDKDGLVHNKPNHHYKVAFVRSALFDAWDPILYKDNSPDKEKSAKTMDFKKLHTLAEKSSSTDADGDRHTIPASNAENIVLIIGDSVAYGAALNNDETLASCLQAKYSAIRFINAGVPGSGTRDNLERLRSRLKTHAGKVRAVIYVHCENDMEGYGTPEHIAGDLHRILEEHKIAGRYFVYSQFIFRVMPDVLRDKNYDDLDIRKHWAQKKEIVGLLQRYGITLIDGWKLVDEYRVEQGTPFDGFALYVDKCHYSALGTQRLAAMMPDLSAFGAR